MLRFGDKLVLTAVESCPKDISLNYAQYDTWAKHAYFFYGRDFFYDLAPELTAVRLNVPDDYPSLSLKTKAICRYAWYAHCDYLHIVDSDVYARPWNLQLGDYVGTEYHHSGYAWGCYYTLSRRAIQILKDAPITSTIEDQWVGSVMAAHGIEMTLDPSRIMLDKAGGHTRRNWNIIPPTFSAVAELSVNEMTMFHEHLIKGTLPPSGRGVFARGNR